jgi:hypothetical protein
MTSRERLLITLRGDIADRVPVAPFVLPYEKRVVEAIRAAGKFSVYHNCGCAKPLYANYRELGMTVWETVSEPPRGDNNLAVSRAAGKEIRYELVASDEPSRIQQRLTARPPLSPQDTLAMIFHGQPYAELPPAAQKDVDQKRYLSP